MVSVPPGEVVRFMGKLFHSGSVRMVVSMPVGSTSVAWREEALSSAPTFHRK